MHAYYCTYHMEGHEFYHQWLQTQEHCGVENIPGKLDSRSLRKPRDYSPKSREVVTSPQ